MIEFSRNVDKDAVNTRKKMQRHKVNTRREDTKRVLETYTFAKDAEVSTNATNMLSNVVSENEKIEKPVSVDTDKLEKSKELGEFDASRNADKSGELSK